MFKKTYTYTSTKPKHKTLKIILLAIIILILGVGVWIGAIAYKNIKKITALSGNNSLFSFLGDSRQALKGETDGRTNILLLGMGGKNHPGGMLSDTIIVISINWKTKQVAMITIPRDLWVKIPGYGYAKINEAYAYGENNKTSGGGGKVSSDVVSEILGIPIHYFVSADFEGFKKLVDNIGGIDVINEKDLYDPSYPADNMIDYDPFKLSAGAHHLDGATALKYARCRKGNCGDDFGRGSRQLQVIKAIKDQTLSLNILSNPKKLVDLMNIAGDHIRTNMSVQEIKSLADVQKDLDTQNIISKVLDTSADGPLVSPPQDGRGSIILPKKGQGNYTDLQKIARDIFGVSSSSAAVQGESINKNFKIEVLNGSNRIGKAKAAAKVLEKDGYEVSRIGDAINSYDTSIVYNCADKTAEQTAQDIAEILSAEVKTKTVCSGIDLQVIVGVNNNL